MEDGFYTRISEMEPMMPSDATGELGDLAIEVIRKSAAISAAVHPLTQRGIIELVRRMNSYYSNLIEGHNTHPVDIDRAMREDFSKDPAKRARQLESKAHIEVQRCIESRIENAPEVVITSKSFLCWIHKEFYERMPEEYLVVQRADGKTEKVVPGETRKLEVAVGRHLPPKSEYLNAFMKRFEDVYDPHRLKGLNQVITTAASHHRLAWIHPFLDGNGRVTRLLTHAYLKTAKIDGHGLWTVSRGFARNREQYLAALAGADQPRRGDLDGRGNLTQAGLLGFCKFFLKTAIDQIDFMAALLDLDGMQKRIQAVVDRKVSFGELRPEAGHLLRDVFLRGEIPRGEIPRIIGMPERSARRVASSLLEKGYLVSGSGKGPVMLGFPASMVGYYFPRLYPEGVEASLE
ncbi:Fic family protein [Geotalea sp. SG265]|uniref:Fic family protein n=1 Tax=Geotalea sp. SG265 TaxID=2922867 RepID=UPI001FAF1169|nr:Fic family protein [Geotalea sp. SG265]